MNTQDTRRALLKQLIDDVGLQTLAGKVKKPPSQLLDMVKGRKAFGEKVARGMESVLGFEAGWFDRSTIEDPIPQSSKGNLTNGQTGSVTLSADDAVGIIDAVLTKIGADWATIGVRRETVVARLQAKIEGRELPGLQRFEIKPATTQKKASNKAG